MSRRNYRMSRHWVDIRRKWVNFGPFQPKIRKPFFLDFAPSENDFSGSGMEILAWVRSMAGIRQA